MTVEVDIDVPAGHGGVGEAERGVLPPADDVRAALQPALQLVAAAGAVVDRQGGGDLLRSRRRLAVALRILALLALLWVPLLVALLLPRLRGTLLIGLLRRVSLLVRRLWGLLAVLLLPLLTLLVPHPLAVAGCVVRLRRVAGVRARIALTLVTRPRVTLVGRAVLAGVPGQAVLLALVYRWLPLTGPRVLASRRFLGIMAVF